MPSDHPEAKTGDPETRKRKARDGGDNRDDDLPQPFDAKTLQPAKKRHRSSSPGPSGNANNPGNSAEGAAAPRKLKRPGQRARISEAERGQIRQRALERERAVREEEASRLAQASTSASASTVASTAAAAVPGRAAIDDVVKAHYNAVPERGRSWRKTDSRIKGLRSFNNWVKSCIIQKFAPDEDHAPGAMERGISSGAELCVLDIGCGKGGDLGKWQQSPQPVQLYVGVDPAEVSIDQARERYRQMRSRGGHGGRGGGRGGFRGRPPPPPLFEGRFHVKDCYSGSIGDIDIIRQVGFAQSSVSSHRGFDVVSMMFCLHYAFESEEKARQMLQNVASSLKKGGRFIGCIPNSDIISARVEDFNRRQAEKAKNRPPADEKREPAEDGELDEGEVEETAEWGNDIYRVRFPGKTPADGVFRPPFGWKYSFFLHEAVDEVPEYVVPWEALRALAENYNLELQYHKTFSDVWETEKDDRELGPLSERMGVRERHAGPLLVTPEEMEAANLYAAFCFYKV